MTDVARARPYRTGCARRVADGCRQRRLRQPRRAVPRPFPGAPLRPAQPEPAEPTATPDRRLAIASERRSPRRWRCAARRTGTAAAIRRGFDCSGFVQWVFAQHGTVAAARGARAVPRSARRSTTTRCEPGDLVFFETVSKGPSHVGIALGGGEFVHAPSSRGVVRVERYTKTELLGASAGSAPDESLCCRNRSIAPLDVTLIAAYAARNARLRTSSTRRVRQELANRQVVAR